MDLITKNLIENYRDIEGFLAGTDESTLFEHFCNFCIISKEYNDDFQVEDIYTGGKNDLQIDGIAVIVNNVLVTSVEEVDDLLMTNKYLEVKFIFIQSTTSSSFEGAKISNMFFGIRDLLSEAPTLPRNEHIAEKEKLIKYIYSKSPSFTKGRPKMKIYFASTGKWQNDEQLLGRVGTEISDLENLNIFEPPIDFDPVDATKIQQYYNQAQNALTKTFTFSKKVTLPRKDGVKEAYIGLLPAKEYLSLIIDDDGQLIRGLFYDNVRDYQGENTVNEEIAQTLTTDKKSIFALLNNGITIVADDLMPTGESFTLSGYQIVNGCQTSHVLFNNIDELTDDIEVPVKLIIRPADPIKNLVVKATNRQTVVKEEELSALTDFQKKLEQYYNAIPEEFRLYYERRSQQFRSIPGLEKIRIVSISTQIRAFASMFLDKAHQASRYYGTLLADVKNRIFLDNHPPIAYYVSAYALFKLEYLWRRRQIGSQYRPFKYHVLSALRMVVAGYDMPNMASNKFEKYCEVIRDVLWDEKECTKNVMIACELLDDIIGEDFNRDRAKDSTIQAKIKTRIEKQAS